MPTEHDLAARHLFWQIRHEKEVMVECERSMSAAQTAWDAAKERIEQYRKALGVLTGDRMYDPDKTDDAPKLALVE